MPSKRHRASSARLIALNSMCAMACTVAARPAKVVGDRRGTFAGCANSGRCGLPGSLRVVVHPSHRIALVMESVEVASGKAKTSSAFAAGSASQSAVKASSRKFEEGFGVAVMWVLSTKLTCLPPPTIKAFNAKLRGAQWRFTNWMAGSPSLGVMPG